MSDDISHKVILFGVKNLKEFKDKFCTYEEISEKEHLIEKKYTRRNDKQRKKTQDTTEDKKITGCYNCKQKVEVRSAFVVTISVMRLKIVKWRPAGNLMFLNPFQL